MGASDYQAAYCEVYRPGRMDYERARLMQEQMAEAIGNGERPPALLLLEHPHIFTLGSRSRPEHLLWDAAELARRGVSLHTADRGGEVTYHGPGQLVGYPLLRLSNLSNGVDTVGYLRRLEEVLIHALAQMGVQAERAAGRTGVWVQSGDSPPAKIASIGARVDTRGVTRHGFALNVNPDMSYWSGIIACGLPDARPAALADYLQPLPSMDGIIACVIASFGQVFGLEMLEVEQQSVESGTFTGDRP